VATTARGHHRPWLPYSLEVLLTLLGGLQAFGNRPPSSRLPSGNDDTSSNVPLPVLPQLCSA